MSKPVLSTMAPWRLRTSTFSNAAYVVLTSDVLVAQVGTMSASRVVTLPLSAAFNPGGSGRNALIIVDESGSVSLLNSLVLTASGTDKINGAATLALTLAYGTTVLIANGVSAWTRIT